MPVIHFDLADGTRKSIEGDIGTPVMFLAKRNDIEGILAECGGACACATCHSYIDEQWLGKLPAMDDMEDAMLDTAEDRRSNSRLTCQIEVTGDLDGLALSVADNET